jgi:hypothetical protein
MLLLLHQNLHDHGSIFLKPLAKGLINQILPRHIRSLHFCQMEGRLVEKEAAIVT